MKNKISFFIAACLGLLIILANISYLPENILSWDVFGYYLYLPFTFIYNDLGLHNISVVQDIISQYNNTPTFYQVVQSPAGDYVLRYQMGMAVLYLPGFFGGHIFALLSGFPADGFSAPYQYGILIENILVTIIGIFLIRYFLLEYFRDNITALILVILILGTNFIYHNGFHGANAMNHNYLFTLYALLLIFTKRLHETFKMKFAIFLGVVIGLIVLARPPELICILIPVLWGIYDKTSFTEKLNLIVKYKWLVIVLGLVILAIGSLQLLYYKFSSGKFFFYSYGGNKGEGFDFLNPHTIDFLFSFQKGWLLYTPILIFSIIGFYFLYRKNRIPFWGLFIFFLINLYIVSSWSTWWGGETFSQKNVIQSYTILALPTGYLLMYLSRQKKYIRIIFGVVFTFLICLNLFQTWQILHGVIHPSRMSKPYYMKVFGKTSIAEEDKKLLLVERSFTYEETFKNPEDYNNTQDIILDFEDLSSGNAACFSDNIVHSGSYAFVMDSASIFSPNIRIPYADITSADHAWLRIEAWVYPVSDPKIDPLSLVITFQHKGGNYKYRSIDIENLSMELNKWNLINLDYMTPWPRTKQDELLIYFWHRGKNPIIVDDLSVAVYERKY